MINVDYSFVQGAAHDPKDAAITANLVNLARALGLVAIAEGIESHGQLTSMQSFGCDLGQGYLFARPMPADQLNDLLANGVPEFAPTRRSHKSAATKLNRPRLIQRRSCPTC